MSVSAGAKPSPRRPPTPSARPSSASQDAQAKGVSGAPSLKDAAAEVLRLEGRPLRVPDIVRIAERRSLLSSRRKASRGGVAAAITSELASAGRRSIFRRIDAGLYGLSAWTSGHAQVNPSAANEMIDTAMGPAPLVSAATKTGPYTGCGISGGCSTSQAGTPCPAASTRSPAPAAIRTSSRPGLVSHYANSARKPPRQPVSTAEPEQAQEARPAQTRRASAQPALPQNGQPSKRSLETNQEAAAQPSKRLKEATSAPQAQKSRLSVPSPSASSPFLHAAMSETLVCTSPTRPEPSGRLAEALSRSEAVIRASETSGAHGVGSIIEPRGRKQAAPSRFAREASMTDLVQAQMTDTVAERSFDAKPTLVFQPGSEAEKAEIGRALGAHAEDVPKSEATPSPISKGHLDLIVQVDQYATIMAKQGLLAQSGALAVRNLLKCLRMHQPQHHLKAMITGLVSGGANRHRDSPGVLFCLGFCLLQGWGMKPNVKAAAQILKNCAEQGFGPARYLQTLSCQEAVVLPPSRAESTPVAVSPKSSQPLRESQGSGHLAISEHITAQQGPSDAGITFQTHELPVVDHRKSFSAWTESSLLTYMTST